MIAFDTEDDGKGNVTLINFFDGKNHTTFDKKNFSNQLELKKAALKYIINSKEKLFCAHNLEYDLVNIFYPYFMSTLELMYSSRLITAKLLHTHKKFIDSFNFSFSSLKNIGAELDLPKIETDDFYNIEYCRRDTEIVYKFINKFRITVDEEFSLPLKMTLAGTSQNIFLKHFCPEKIANKNKDENILNSYYGGRCEVFRLGEIHDYVFSVDVNSMYPYVMKNFLFPAGKFVITKEPKTEFFIAEVDIEINDDIYIPIIPYRTDRLLFPSGKFRTWVTSVELSKAIREKQVRKISYRRAYNFFNPINIFGDFVDYFYQMRFSAKEAGKNFESNFYKRILNSVYGRFALKSNISFIGPYKKSDNWTDIGNNLILSQKDFIKRNINYALPVFITAYSRVVLYELFKKISKIGGKIIYTDTDSVYFHFHKKIDLQNKIQMLHRQLPISNRLGELSIDVYRGGSFQNAKAYLLQKFDANTAIKFKGIPIQNREQYFQTGSTIYKRPMKLRPALRGVQGIKPNEWYDFYIENKGCYTKRSLVGMNKFFSDTKPLNIEIET